MTDLESLNTDELSLKKDEVEKEMLILTRNSHTLKKEMLIIEADILGLRSRKKDIEQKYESLKGRLSESKINLSLITNQYWRRRDGRA